MIPIKSKMDVFTHTEREKKIERETAYVAPYQKFTMIFLLKIFQIKLILIFALKITENKNLIQKSKVPVSRLPSNQSNKDITFIASLIQF